MGPPRAKLLEIAVLSFKYEEIIANGDGLETRIIYCSLYNNSHDPLIVRVTKRR